MTRSSSTGDKTGKAGKAKGRSASPAKRKAASTRRRGAPAAPRVKRSVSGPGQDLNEARAQQAATAEILKVIASSRSDVQPVFQAIATNANRLLGGFSTAVFRFVDDVAHLAAFTPTTPAADDVLKASFPMPLADFEPFQMVKSGRAVQIADIERMPNQQVRQIARRRGFRSMLFVPLMSGSIPMGSISVTRTTTGSFADHHVTLLQTFADQAVIAIENARLFNETREALERQTATAEILKVIASSPSDVQPVFEAIAERSNRLIGGHATAVYRFVGEMVQLEAFTPVSAEADAALKASYPRPIAGELQFELVRGGKVAQIADTDSENVAAITTATARIRGWRSVIFMPLTGDAGVIGAITVTRKEAGAFADHHVRLLHTFADQAVIAIENARLFNETKEALERQTATAEILKIIASSPSDVQPVFDVIVERAVQLCGARMGRVYRYDGNLIHLVGGHGLSVPAREGARRPFPRPAADDTIVGRVMLSRRPTILADLNEDATVPPLSRQMIEALGARSQVTMPMLLAGEPIGAITLSWAEPSGYNDHQIALLQTFADQAVIAIENVRLFRQVQERTRELSASLDELRAAQDRLVQTEKLASLGQLTAGIAHEIKNPLNFVNNFSALSAELIDELDDVLGPAPLDQKMRTEVGDLTRTLKSNLEKVVQHGRRADSIVKNMLLHSREGSGEHRSADINALVEESLNLAWHGARAEKSDFNIALQRDLDPSAGMADVYPQEIARALLNLISNGFYAATKRRAEAGDTFEPVLSAATKDLGSEVEIRIRDNGTGIPEEAREKIFNPFFTTKPSGEGTGLGLSMCHDIIVKQHGGSIDVETEPGVFTEFRIVLPRASRRQSAGR